MCRSIQWFWKCGCRKETVLDRCEREFERGHVIKTGFRRESAIMCEACFYSLDVGGGDDEDDYAEIIVDRRGKGKGKGKGKDRGKGKERKK